MKAGTGPCGANSWHVRRLTLPIAAFLVALALAPTARGFNPQIAGLQIALRERGLYPGPIDAVQGPKTVRAVRTFQRRHRLVVDGIGGPRTRAALGTRGRPALRSPGHPARHARLRRRRAPVPAQAARRAARPARRELRPEDGARRPPVPAAGRAHERRRRRPAHGEATLLAADLRLARPREDGLGAIPRRLLVEGVRRRPGLVRAVARWESGYNNSLVSVAGAHGVMQVRPTTWNYVETVLVGRQIPHTTSGNVQVGVVFLRQLLREFRGDVRLALAAYAQGPRSVRRHGLFRETRRYVAGVLALSRRL